MGDPPQMKSSLRAPSVRRGYVDHPDFHNPEKLHRILESIPTQDVPAADRATPGDSTGTSWSAETERMQFMRLNCLKFLASDRRSRTVEGKLRESDRRAADALEASARELRDELAVRYLPVVKHVVRSITPNRSHQEELIGEGSLILLRVIDFFDVRMGFRFSSYASAALRRELRRQFSRQMQKRAHLLSTIEFDPMDRESIERPYGDECVSAARAFLSTLPAREQEIIRMRFGFCGEDRTQSYRSLSEHFGISGERLRQIVERACRRARHLISE